MAAGGDPPAADFFCGEDFDGLVVGKQASRESLRRFETNKWSATGQQMKRNATAMLWIETVCGAKRSRLREGATEPGKSAD